MTILEETLNEFLRQTTDLILGVPGYAVRAKQDAPRPTGAYASVDFMSDTLLGWEASSYENNVTPVQTVTQTIKGLREIMFSISFYRSTALDDARRVHIGLARDSIISLFNQAKLGLIRRSEVREISEALENGWEERAQFDVFLSAVGTDQDIVYCIEAVDISGEFQTRGISIPVPIEVPPT